MGRRSSYLDNCSLTIALEKKGEKKSANFLSLCSKENKKFLGWAASEWTWVNPDKSKITSIIELLIIACDVIFE